MKTQTVSFVSIHDLVPEGFDNAFGCYFYTDCEFTSGYSSHTLVDIEIVLDHARTAFDYCELNSFEKELKEKFLDNMESLPKSTLVDVD